MLTKTHKIIYRKWMMGRLNLVAVARKLGYKKASLTKGVDRVRSMLKDMGITVL